jgi:acetoin utilization protein AcuA
MRALTAPDTASAANHKRDLVSTVSGPVWLERHATVDTIEALEVDDGIGILTHYTPRAPERQKETLLRAAAMPGTNVVIAYTLDGYIVGYIGLAPPSAADRWGGAGFEFIYELGFMEVSRYWRGLGLVDRLLAAALADEGIEDRILVSTSYAWHWDLEQSGLSKWQYRARLHAIHARHGFVELDTDEENIRCDPANLLMARYGARVSRDQLAQFESTLLSDLE